MEDLNRVLDTSEESMADSTIFNYLSENAQLESLEALKTAQTWTGFFSLLKELTRASLNDFWFKVAILLTLYQNTEKIQWTPQEIVQEFHWIQENVRKKLIAQLSKSTWLEFSEGTYKLSVFARSILSTFTSLIHQENMADALGASISSLTLLEMYQNDPTNTLRMFLNELIRVDNDIVTTMESKSEYLVRKLNKRIRNQFNVAIKSREHLENLPTDNYNSYRLKQEIHEKLSGFHARLSQVQKAQNDLVARQIILADKTLTHNDINTYLINATIDDLAKIGRKAVSIPIQVKDMIPQLMVYETEWQLEKEQIQKDRRSWSEAEMAKESQETPLQQSRFLNFVGEIQQTLNKNNIFTLEKFIPKENWNMSSFRFSMISVLESRDVPMQLNPQKGTMCPKLQIEYPEQEPFTEMINDPFTAVKEITKANVAYAEE
ncbi:MAG: hypothetical protein KBC30_06715 [Planctomycetes bacterium]|nr:hypothetical protein [Planctomycetota bacterium]HNZ66904.1 hypothetical protein [Planctomycetota bacterium]HPY75070.1 hypothetical protein [Planctomycetota bacterium]HQB00731.1 hypothetical protein [Planctomycetota bacterium]